MQRSKKRSLFDHFVSPGEQRWWHCEAEGLCGLEIDHKFELGGLFDWQVCGFGALEYFVNISRRASPHVGLARTIAHYRAGGRRHPEFADDRQAVLRSKRDDTHTVG